MTMTDEAQRPGRKTKRLWLALATVVVILVVLIVPPLVSIGRYKSRITELVSASLGRPVHLSSVELRLLPWPGFVLTDLTVDEDPAFGAEPVLHASSVTTAIRLLSLWRGRLEISSISVDEASLNLVRNREGRWNLDPLFRNAAARSSGAQQRGALPLPYLEATNSRVNIKNGLEKLPYSLVNADLSFWQEKPGDWRVRLRGQPARTDVSLDLADTGILQLEGSIRRAPELHEMPIHLDLEWRQAQLGQLSRLITGSDPGWRGDLTGELHLDGTADAAQVNTRLRATGVHRAEFAPAEPLDFDANCGFLYHYSRRGVQNLVCDSPLGDGHIKVLGDLPGNNPPRLSVELQDIPVQAGLDALRTMRSGLDQELEARGTVSGKLAYDPGAETSSTPPPTESQHRPIRGRAPKKHPPEHRTLLGSLTVEGFRLSGGGLTLPIQVPKFALDPAAVPQGQPQALTASVTLLEGGTAPVTITMQFALSGYQVTVRGPALLPRIRDLAHVAGIANTAVIDSLAGEPAVLDLAAQGPWLPAPYPSLVANPPTGRDTGTEPDSAIVDAASDRLSGTVTFHDANWKSAALASDLEISSATLHLAGDALLWDPVAFAYGPVKGSASLRVPIACESDEPCPPQLEVHFQQLDAGKLQAALLGAHKPDTLLSTLIAQLTPSQSPAWPRIDATIKADSLILGPVTLQNASATLHIQTAQAEIASFDAGLLGGRIHATGTLADGPKPSYTLEGNFEKLAAPALCQLLSLRCTGGALDGNGKVELSGFTDKDLAASAKGVLHFDWQRGSFAKAPGSPVPAALARFSHWTADAEIAKDAVTLNQNQVQQGRHKSAVEASISFGDPPRVTFTAPPAKPE
ncbi:MAG: AsmA family protein [Terracidiphilus sp.]